ncbi:MAG: HD-GYP domain-containing protein [Treponema sp.]|nr:HD-GYP domain-containing protein [Treponema sp.]
MMTELLEILETAAVAVSAVLIKKYVFLEPDLQPGFRRVFYGCGIAVVGAVFAAFGKDVAALAVLFLTGLSVCLGRKTRRLRALLLIIPLPGIISGLFVPVMRVPPYLIGMTERSAAVYQLAMYGVAAVLLVLFLVKGKPWRNWFHGNMQRRSLRKSERYLLWSIGILQLFFSVSIAAQIEAGGAGIPGAAADYVRQFDTFIGISSITAFVMTVTIIVLIMQGNRRAFYHEKVAAMQSGMITLMAEIVENRDGSTGGHIRRTAAYVEKIARELQKQGAYPDILTDAYVQNMVVAAPLHDIGKIHIPDAVLQKPGRLTEEEFAVMKTHAEAGRRLIAYAKTELGESAYLSMAEEMAVYHHEWWDGRGYPRGCKGEEIPLCARIMAVADVFDALTSRRCYKDAMPLEKAYAIIRAESGTHFDPAVVEAFFSAKIR